MHKKFTFLSVIIAALLSVIPQLAQARQFDIELIIFERNDPQPTGEYWDQSQQKLSITPRQWLLAPLMACEFAEFCEAPNQLPTEIDGATWAKQGPTPVKMLPKSQFGLEAQWRTISQHAAFKPLLHMAWREDVPSRGKAKFLGVQAGDRLPINLTDSADSHSPQWELQGGVRIYLQHYLYIDSQLLLTKLEQRQSAPIESNSSDDQNEVTLAGPDEGFVANGDEEQQLTQLVSYKFDQKRRVRSGEIHYFDHPKLGMIIQIRKIPEPQAAAANDDEDSCSKALETTAEKTASVTAAVE